MTRDAPPARLQALARRTLGAHAAGEGVPRRLWDTALLGLLDDFLGRPSKRVRARLVVHAHRAAGGAEATLPPELPLLVELIHAGSLLVDDVQDGAETRRGAPAAHRLFGEALAINTGGWLYFAPLVALQQLPVEPAVRLALYDRMVATMARCHEGQALDLAARVDALAWDEVVPVVRAITRAKTGALMRLAAATGALAAGAAPGLVEALGRFGEQAGVALQMYDDLSGLLRPDLAHKADEDLAGARATWPWAWLSEITDRTTYARLTRALADARDDRAARDALRDRLAALVAERGRDQARRVLDAACAELTAAIRPSPARDELCAQMRALEEAYVHG